MKASIYNTSAKETGTVTLPETVFALPWNPTLVHDVVVAMQGNARASTADAKDRSDVRGGGKKPWKQKGTGRARHGSRRSPIWSGGGVAHGPTAEKDYTRKINKKIRAKALAVTLSKKFADGEMLFVDTLSNTEAKAKVARAAITALSGVEGFAPMKNKRKNAVLVILKGRDEAVERSFQNFGNVLVEQAKDINPVSLLSYKYIIVSEPEDAVAILQNRIEKTNA